MTEPNPAQSIVHFIGGHAQPIVLIDICGIFVAAAMSDPGPVARLQNRFNRRNQPAWRHDAFGRSPAAHVHIRLAI